MQPGSKGQAGQGGFTYMGLLIVLAVIALVGSAGVQLGAVSRRRAAEQALLETGAAFSAALRSYAQATPAGQPTSPKSLQDLLRDPRYPGAVRHLRKIFVDPLTGTPEWGLVLDEEERGISAVYSLASGKPIKLAGFDSRFVDFDGKRSYRDWRFSRPPETSANPNGLRNGLISPGELTVDGVATPEPASTQPAPDAEIGLVSPRSPR